MMAVGMKIKDQVDNYSGCGSEEMDSIWGPAGHGGRRGLG